MSALNDVERILAAELVALNERAQRAEARVRALEEAQGELLDAFDHSVRVEDRPDYCRVCDRHFR